MSLEFLLRIMKARWYILASTLCLACGAAVAAALLMPKSYVATADFVVNASGQDPISGAQFPAHLLSTYLATQTGIIGSPAVASRVVEQTGLADDKTLQVALFGESPLLDQWEQRLKGLLPVAAEQDGALAASDQRTAYAKELLQQLTVQTALEGSIISISFAAHDPALAARFANAFAAAYMQISVELRTSPAKQVSEWYVSQLASLRQQLEQAQQTYTAYQRESGLIGIDQHLDLELVRLADLSSKLLDTESERLASTTRAQQVRQQGSQMAEVVNDSVVQRLRGELAQAEARLVELQGRVGENHPQYREAQTDVATLRNRLEAEAARVSSTMASRASLLLSQERQLRSQVEEQRSRVLALREQRDHLTLLAREVEHAERSYDVALERASQTRLESQLLPHATASLLNSAVPPLQASSPSLRLNLAAGVFLGGVFGLLLITRAERVDRRVRGAADLERMLELPILAEPPALSRRTRASVLAGGA